MLVQPYLAAVDTAGETALIYVDGRVQPRDPQGADAAGGCGPPGARRELYVAETIEARVPEPAELAVGAVVAGRPSATGSAPTSSTPGSICCRRPHGPVVVELELTEPSLFLQHGSGDDDPAATFAAAIAARA